MRRLKSLAPLSMIALVWLLFLAELMSAIFAETVLYGGRFTPLHWVTYQKEPTLFVVVLFTSLVAVCFFGWILLGLISKSNSPVVNRRTPDPAYQPRAGFDERARRD